MSQPQHKIHRSLSTTDKEVADAVGRISGYVISVRHASPFDSSVPGGAPKILSNKKLPEQIAKAARMWSVNEMYKAMTLTEYLNMMFTVQEVLDMP